MSRYSAGVCRMMAVLNVIASAPGQSFSFAEVVRLSSVSRATAHGILLALVRDNYLTRDEEKRFSIGPAFRDIAARVGGDPAIAG
ncbi:helix-turn-helix domain-containing protein [Novosphingobium sp. G106]|uniref:helix-turn-helix domain-containing protein n=1 Tax=Novosphingobium sp. G106 TaxID=2849500 RepID=UPI001C2D28BF|nr:helix-turn-helix domain-containing protein [Novosphingobium sp. G106]MBV1689380.1 helix-turn-helix domain-containing protein [Novosphingobium sp. G106]